jgi:hypothetical protein
MSEKTQERGDKVFFGGGNIGGFVLVNDSRTVRGGRYLCGEEPVVYDDYWEAVDEAKRLREEYDNPHINLYPVMTHPVDMPED